MIERTKTVKSAEWKDTKDEKRQYLSAVLVGEDGKESTQAIFEPSMQDTIQTALKENLPLLIGIEKEGQYWNLKTVRIGGDATPHTPTKPTETKPQYSGRTEKDDDILLAVAFKGAVELEGNLVPGAEPNTTRVLLTTAELMTGLVLLRPKREAK